MSQAPDHGDRLGAFDLLRFIAASMVVCLHHGVWDVVSMHSPLSVDPALGEWFKYGKFGVDIFFVISGYFVFLTADGRGAMDFAIARASRLYPALLVFCTVSFVVISLWGALPAPETPHLKNYLGNLSLVSFVTAFLPGFNGAGYVEGVYWTLAYEFVWYAAVFAFLLRGGISGPAGAAKKSITVVSTNASQNFLVQLTGVSLALWAVLWFGMNEKIGQIGEYMPYFILGAQMYLLSRHGQNALGWACFAVNAGLVGVSVYYRAVGGLVHLPHDLFFNPVIAIAMVAAAIGVMMLAAWGKIRIGGPVIATLGACTYPLYLMHDRVGVVIAEHVGWMRGLPGLLALLTLFIVIAALFARYVEPAMISTMKAWLRRITGQQAKPHGVRAVVVEKMPLVESGEAPVA